MFVLSNVLTHLNFMITYFYFNSTCILDIYTLTYLPINNSKSGSSLSSSSSLLSTVSICSCLTVLCVFSQRFEACLISSTVRGLPRYSIGEDKVLYTSSGASGSYKAFKSFLIDLYRDSVSSVCA